MDEFWAPTGSDSIAWQVGLVNQRKLPSSLRVKTAELTPRQESAMRGRRSTLRTIPQPTSWDGRTSSVCSAIFTRSDEGYVL